MQKYMGRTDLALEIQEKFTRDKVEISGVELEKWERNEGRIRISKVTIRTSHGARVMEKPIGRYSTIEFVQNEGVDMVVTEELREMLSKTPTDGPFLVLGLGNRRAVADALGSRVVDDIIITRHRKLDEAGGICAIAPGVTSQTGMEALEIIQALVHKIQPECVLVIDSLAAQSHTRLCHSIQITDSGICPGSGVGEHKSAIDAKTLGVPVLAIGVPTVMEIYPGQYVTPKDIDFEMIGLSHCLVQAIEDAILEA